MKCKRNCSKALLSLSITSIGRTIDNFTQDMGLLRQNPELLQTFYDYVSAKYGVRCEAGINLIERMVMVDGFKQLLSHSDSTNELINQKILLYAWIRPEHLELKRSQEMLKGVLESFKSIQGSLTPTEKIQCIMEGIEKLHEVIGRDMGQDEILPSIIYCLIRSATTNIHSETQFMTLYRRRSFKKCDPGCNHGLGIDISCACLQKKTYDEKEVTYYLTSMQAAIDFIKKMEYYDLRISEAEFNQNIAGALKLMKEER